MSLARQKRPINILLVEDNQADQRLAVECLKTRENTCDLFIARDGVEALEFLKRKGLFASVVRPDIILLDLNLPRMDGRELLKIVKNDSELNHIPVIVFTTSSMESDIRQCYQLGANAYVKKPLGLDEFGSIISEIQSFWSKSAEYSAAAQLDSECDNNALNIASR